MVARVLCLVTSLAALAIASPAGKRSPYAVKETHFVPAGWSRVGDAPSDHTIDLSIGLRQERFDELEAALLEVSDPAHSRYGQHLSSAEVNELIKPSTSALDQVQDWLAEHGVKPISFSAAKDWIKVKLPVSAAERLLDTRYSVYRHEDGSHLVRTPEWSLPEHLHEFVRAIQPTTAFLRSNPQRKTVMPLNELQKLAPGQYPGGRFGNPYPSGGSVSQVCNVSAVTPDCLRTLYETINYTPLAAGKNKVGLCDYLGESNNRSDVHLFLENYRPEAAGAAYTFLVDVIAGGNNQQTPETPAQLAAGKDLEGNLDAETILGITYPTPLTAYTTGGSPPFMPDENTPTDTNEPYLTWVQYVLGQSDAEIPQTISTSYGDDEQTVPRSYAQTVCSEFAQLGARGVSIIFSSGDFGVGYNGTCVSNDGKNTPMFIPNFPASCPYVTTVGATHEFSPEVVAYDPANGFASSGGFSNYFPRPSYQDAAVSGYLAQIGNEYQGLYNRSGRGYPDISAQGEHFVTIWDGMVVLLDGTSASSPTAASVISLVNDALIAAGKSPLGFLNPFLYSFGYNGFFDVTSGSAVGCDTAGFPAKKGWDAVSGFGTPRFEQLLPLAFASSK